MVYSHVTKCISYSLTGQNACEKQLTREKLLLWLRISGRLARGCLNMTVGKYERGGGKRGEERGGDNMCKDFPPVTWLHPQSEASPSWGASIQSTSPVVSLVLSPFEGHYENGHPLGAGHPIRQLFCSYDEKPDKRQIGGEKDSFQLIYGGYSPS